MSTTTTKDLHKELNDAEILIESLQSKIEQLEQRDKWISVDERLPEEGQLVLGCRDLIERNSFDASEWESKYWKMNNYTHWKPITPPDSKPELLDHHTSEDCWCEPEEVSDGVFVHKDRH